MDIALRDGTPANRLATDLKQYLKHPKEFEFVGWHPHCRCHAVPIMEDVDSFQARQDALLRGERIPPTGQVTEPPKNFTDHLKDNSDRLQRANKAGTLPYFVRDNYITDKDGGLFPLFGYETNTLKLKAFKAKTIELHHGKTFRDGITISNKAIKEWFNQPHVARNSKDKALFNIGKVLDTSTYIGQGIDKHDPNIKMHIYQTKVGLTDSWIVVRELPNGKKILHSISDNPRIVNHIKKTSYDN